MTKNYWLYPTLFIALICFAASNVHAQADECAAHPTDPVMHAEHCAVMALVPYGDATHVAINSGSWFSTSTWNTGTLPGNGANVFINAGVVVTYDGSSDNRIHWLRVNGTLQFATNVNTKLKVNTIIVDPLGTFTIGTVAAPVLPNYIAQIIFPNEGPIDTNWDPNSFSKGLVSHGFTTTNGSYKKPFIGLNKVLNAGASTIKLPETPTGWQVGDQLILPGTYANRVGNDADNSRFHDEVLTITSISGKTIHFTNNANGSTSLLYDHKFPVGYGLKIYIGNMTRNVKFITEDYATVPNSQRGHVMLMHNANQNMYYTEFDGLGRTDKSQLVTDPVLDADGNLVSGGANPRGRYSCHIHRAGANDPLITPVHIQGCVVFDTPGWGFVNHESNVIMEDNIVYQFRGAGFVTETGSELGAFNRNLAVKGASNLDISSVARVNAFDFGYEGNGYWIQSSNVSYSNNIAASCAGDAFRVLSDDADLADSRRVKIPAANILDPSLAGTDDSIYTAMVPLRLNTGSIAYNCTGGMSFWTHLYNNDNVGDFSSVQYAPYTHNKMSVVDNFKFWNLLGTGISVKYSGQVDFKNGLLLGDVTNQFSTSDWGTGNPEFGWGFITSMTTGPMWYENLTVKGWKRAAVVMRTDDLVSGDDNEYNFRLSKISGGLYENNVYNLYPEQGQSAYYVPDYYQFPKYFEISGNPVFHVTGSNTLPVADFSYVSKGGNAVQVNGILSNDADIGITGGGNRIAAYAWTFGDGTTAYGVDPVHYYTSAGTYAVTLTVYDSQGQTASITKNVYVVNMPYSNIVVNPGFETGTFVDNDQLFTTYAFINKGWFRKSDWTVTGGKAEIYSSDKWNRTLSQVIKNDYAMHGTIDFSFQARNMGPGASGNNLIVQIFGVNGELNDGNTSTLSNIKSWNNDDPTFSSTLLLNEEFGLSTYDWQTFHRNLNFNNGYQYVVIKFYSQGIKVGPAEDQGLDNICMPCICGIPQSGLEDQLTSTHANLIWDNVGSTQYHVQFKPLVGGAWVTYTVNNTYLDMSSLTPNTTYQWKVSALCDGSWTAYSTIRQFITPVAGSTCTSPVDLSTTLITNNQAKLNWNKVTGASQYQINYKKTADVSWTSVNTTNNFYTITGLVAATNYQWRVKTECAEGWKEFTNLASFNTLALKEDASAGSDASVHVQLYPNPANDYFILNINSTIYTPIQMRIMDITGRILQTDEFTLDSGSHEIVINVQNFNRGAYIVEVTDGHNFSENKKLIIE